VRDPCTATTAAIRWLILGFGGRCPRGRQLAETRVPSARRGRLAQLVERLPYKQEVTGSSPVPPIQKACMSQKTISLGAAVGDQGNK
jgi:hypothetical protein